jgi:5-formyltetrahydrofolate cyclo-ligase
MRFYQASSLSDFSLGYQGIQEPISDRLINSKNIDIFIVPALAINSLGYRLGYGQGFYDKELKGIPTRKIYSVIFDFQFINSQFDQSHDIKVKKVFTEKGVYTIN